MLANASGASILLALSMFACSEPRVDLHFVRRADQPVRGKAVEPTDCADCVSQEWVGPDGSSIHLEIEREPFLVIRHDRLSEPELTHSKWLFLPFCDNYELSFRLAIRLEELLEVSQASQGRIVAALVDGRAIDVGPGIFAGETLRFDFPESRQAAETAALLGFSPEPREADHSWLAGARRSQEESFDHILSDPELRREFAAKTGIDPEQVNREDLFARFFCP